MIVSFPACRCLGLHRPVHAGGAHWPERPSNRMVATLQLRRSTKLPDLIVHLLAEVIQARQAWGSCGLQRLCILIRVFFQAAAGAAPCSALMQGLICFTSKPSWHLVTLWHGMRCKPGAICCLPPIASKMRWIPARLAFDSQYFSSEEDPA